VRSSRTPQSTTSLPQSPHDEESSRIRVYLLTMGIRVVCFILMVAVTPYSWYTLVFGVGAIFLPYVAVVLANVGKDAHSTEAEAPQRELPAPPPPSITPQQEKPTVIRISESGRPGSPS
jgi:hypothetical protein